MKKMCMKCGGKVKMKSGGQTALSKVGVMNENLGTSGQYGFARKGGSTKSKFGLLSVIAGIDNNPKPTAADRIAGAKKRAGKKRVGKKK